MYVEVFPFKLDSGKFPVPDGEKENFEADASLEFGGTHLQSVNADMEFKKRTGRLSEALVNFKRPSDAFCAEAANKRTKLEDKAVSITIEENYYLEKPASVHEVDDERPEATSEHFLRRTPLEQLEAFQFPLSERSHRRRCVPIGSDHQADLPRWTPTKFKRSFHQSHFDDPDSSDSSSVNYSSSSPAMDAGVGGSAIDCCCSDEGSILCVKQHVKEAREKLRRDVGDLKFVELGFQDMGEDVAEGWTKMEDNLFRAVVSSNSALLGRNFWTVLPHVFQSRSFPEIVGYYFNVFMLRKRADQNRFDPLNVDSDDDDWQVNCHDNSMSQEGEEEEEDEGEDDFAFQSPSDGNSLGVEDDVSKEADYQDEIDDEEICCSKPFRSAERNSTDCSLDQDVQDDSCTSFERLYQPERDRENSRKEHRKFEYFDDDCDPKLWEVNYIGGGGKNFDFFPTCNVLEQVFGKGSSSWDKDDGDDSGLS